MKEDKNRPTVNLTERHEKGGYAVYLPAISGFFIQQLAKMDEDPEYFGKGRLGPSFDKGHEGLNFLRDDSYYHYKWGLYSAGHAKLDIEKSKKYEGMVQNRRRDNTIIVGDSGGFQIAKATGDFKKVDWDNFGGAGGDVIRGKIMNWLEETADWSMTLDIPAFAAEPPFNKKTGLTSFDDTLRLSVINLEYFVKNRTPGKTKFLNVLSGSDATTSKKWYDTVKHFSDPEFIKDLGLTEDRTLEGYAFAGANMWNMKNALTRLLDLINDGLIQDKGWIHFLGLGRLDWACYLTAIQRQIRKHYNPEITISFDAASPFVSVAKGQCYSHNSFTPKRWGYNMQAAIDERECKGSKLPMPFKGPIMERSEVGDICRLGPGEPNRLGKVAKTSWDNMSYLLMMSHNVYNHIDAVQEANRIADYEYQRNKLDYHDWTKEKKKSSANEVSDFVPPSILFFNKFVEDLFDPSNKNPYQMLEDHASFLESISFGRKESSFNSLFAMEEHNPEDDYANMDDDDLVKLEEENNDE